MYGLLTARLSIISIMQEQGHQKDTQLINTPDTKSPKDKTTDREQGISRPLLLFILPIARNTWHKGYQRWASLPK